MEKTYCIRNNQLIIYPDTSKERNLTEEGAECRYCKYAPKSSCGYYKPEIDYPACDWQTMGDGWVELLNKYK